MTCEAGTSSLRNSRLVSYEALRQINGDSVDEQLQNKQPLSGLGIVLDRIDSEPCIEYSGIWLPLPKTRYLHKR